ncbi:aromatic ring-hydroxylating oxygenase subunit alpha [Shimia sediminis]|uniref:aromatic ring-hydroxylating oxygenase subunit alpha n=1 Tax=Shimia sediminis TaxID=2497945 RepID=UPI000F8ED8FD|nr:aromatic ring-hydroxylating dioxygenase subunit alpha [Shimia sediminis]
MHDTALPDVPEITDEDIEARLKVGLRNQWWALCPSTMLQDKPISLFRLGYRLVLWRKLDGSVVILEDFCPHRGVPLSRGIAMDDRIACGYHGVQVDETGTAVSVPGSPGCKLEGMKCVRTFPVEERNGVIFAYLSDKNTPNPSAPPLELPEQLTSPEYSSFINYCEWFADYRFVIDNVMDPMHGTYLHKQSHSMAEGEASADFVITPTETGFIFEKEGQRGVNFDFAEWGETGCHWMRLEIPYPKTGGPGGNFHIVGMFTPCEDGKVAVFFWRARKVDGWQRDTWRFLYKNRLEARHHHVLEQDRVMLEDLQCDPRGREILYSHDIGLVRLRRRLANLAREQLEAEAQANAG